MSKQDDGGLWPGGMSLRAWLAGKNMVAILSNPVDMADALIRRLSAPAPMTQAEMIDEVDLRRLNPMNTDNIKTMGIDELREFLGLPGSPKICENGNCMNKPERGIIFCTQCQHGSSEKANPEYQAAKRRLLKLLKEISDRTQ